MPKAEPVEVRFWRKVDRGAAADCWLWTGARLPKGYGHIGFKRTSVRAHRLSWEIHNGLIPEGRQVLHHCDNQPCVNPAHLYLGTNDDNVRDRVTRGRTKTGRRKQCPKGHPYTPDNLMVRASGLRLCRKCKNEASKRNYRRHAERRCAVAKAWRQRNPDKVLQYSRAHTAAIRERANGR